MNPLYYIDEDVTLHLGRISAVIKPRNVQRRTPFDWHFVVVLDGYPLRVCGFTDEGQMLVEAQSLEEAWKRYLNENQN